MNQVQELTYLDNWEQPNWSAFMQRGMWMTNSFKALFRKSFSKRLNDSIILINHLFNIAFCKLAHAFHSINCCLCEHLRYQILETQTLLFLFVNVITWWRKNIYGKLQILRINWKIYALNTVTHMLNRKACIKLVLSMNQLYCQVFLSFDWVFWWRLFRN